MAGVPSEESPCQSQHVLGGFDLRDCWGPPHGPACQQRTPHPQTLSSLDGFRLPSVGTSRLTKCGGTSSRGSPTAVVGADLDPAQCRWSGKWLHQTRSPERKARALWDAVQPYQCNIARHPSVESASAPRNSSSRKRL